MAIPLISKLNKVASFATMFLCITVLVFMALGSIASFGLVNDFPEYGTAARLIVNGQASEVYRLPQFFAAEKKQFPALRSRGIGLFIPPPAVPLLLWTNLIPDSVAPEAWTSILFGALIASVLLIRRTWKLSWEQIAWVLSMLALSGPAVEAVRIGQLAPLLLLALSAMVFFNERGVPLAAALSFSLLCLKPQQMWPLAVFVLACRQYKMVGAVTIVVAVCGIASWFIFGSSGYSDYISIVRDPANLVLMQPEINPTVRGQLMRLMGTQSSVPNGVALFSLVASTIYIIFLGRRAAASKQWLQIGLVGALPIGCLTSMHCHLYDLILLTPGAVALWKEQCFSGKPKLWALIALLVMLVPMLAPFYAEIHYEYILKDGGVWNPYFFLLALFSVGSAYAAWSSCRRTSTQTLSPAEAAPTSEPS